MARNNDEGRRRSETRRTGRWITIARYQRNVGVVREINTFRYTSLHVSLGKKEAVGMTFLSAIGYVNRSLSLFFFKPHQMSDRGPSARLSHASSCGAGPQSRYVAVLSPHTHNTKTHTENRAWSLLFFLVGKKKKKKHRTHSFQSAEHLREVTRGQSRVSVAVETERSKENSR